jgi:hypothetical protein
MGLERLSNTARQLRVGIPVLPIIWRELFDKVQERLEWNRSRYRHPKQVQLLSNLIRCGSCGGSFFAYRRYRNCRTEIAAEVCAPQRRLPLQLAKTAAHALGKYRHPAMRQQGD